MKLRYVETVHFGRSELTNFRMILKKRPAFGKARHPLRLKSNEVVVLVSRLGNQLVFLHSFDHMDGVQVLRSERLRLTNGGAWNPLMLANYAKQVGLHLDGLKTYEDHLKRHHEHV